MWHSGSLRALFNVAIDVFDDP